MLKSILKTEDGGCCVSVAAQGVCGAKVLKSILKTEDVNNNTDNTKRIQQTNGMKFPSVPYLIPAFYQ